MKVKAKAVHTGGFSEFLAFLTHAEWPSGLTRKGKSTYSSGMLLYEQISRSKHTCVQALLPTYKKKEFLSMYVPTYAVAANSTHTNAQRNSCFVNELDGATEVRHDMGAPPICRIAKLYIVSKIYTSYQ